MPTMVGYVGTIEAETRNVSRLWFSLTAEPNGANWIKIGAPRAWFTMDMDRLIGRRTWPNSRCFWNRCVAVFRFRSVTAVRSACMRGDSR